MKNRKFLAMVGLVLFLASMVLAGCKTTKPNQNQMTKYGVPATEY